MHLNTISAKATAASADTRLPAIVRNGAGETFHYFDYGTRCLVGCAPTLGDFALLHSVVPCSAGAGPHRHGFEDEAFFVESGRFAFTIEERTIVANAGDFLFAPRGLVHGYRNIGKTPGQLLLLVAPGDVENLYRGLTQSHKTSSGAPSHNIIRDLLASFGVEFFDADPSANYSELSGDNVSPTLKRKHTLMTTLTARPFVTACGKGRTFDMGDHRITCLATADKTGGAFSLFDVHAEPLSGPPPHIHEREDETFYILSGRVTVMLGDKTFEAGPGDCVFAPRGVPHGWQNGLEPAHALVVVTPGGFENFFGELATLIEAGMKLGPSLAPNDVETLLTLFERYGLSLLPPA